MNYNIIALETQKHILGNFLYINDNLEQTPYNQKFNIYYLDDLNSFPEFDLENNKTISLIPNKKYYFCMNIQEIFDRFQLPHLYINKENIEQYY